MIHDFAEAKRYLSRLSTSDMTDRLNFSFAMTLEIARIRHVNKARAGLVDSTF